MSADPEIACDLAEDLDVRHLAIRSIYGSHLLALDDERLGSVADMIDRRGFSVSALLSPLFKAYPPGVVGPPLVDPHVASFSEAADDHIGLEESLGRIAEMFRCQTVRVFSFLRSGGDEARPLEVEASLRRLVESPYGDVFALENEHICYVATIDELRETSTAIPIRAILDVANHWRLKGVNGIDLIDQELCGRLCDVHVKDMLKDGTFTPSGLGAVGWRPILGKLRALGYQGPVTLEAHLSNDLDGVRRSIEWLNRVLADLK